MIKKYGKIGVFALAVLFCTAFIFSNSLKDSVESHNDSSVIVEIVKNLMDKIAPHNELDWNFIVRKTAHLIEFFVLGVVLMLSLLQTKSKRRNDFVYAVIIATVIAMIDEFIQSFVGRGDSLTDVIIDVTGAFLGIFLIYLIDVLTEYRRAKKTIKAKYYLNCE